MHTILAESNVTPAALAPTTATQGARLLIALFVLSLLIPSFWEIAGLRVDTARIYALCMVIPLSIRWLSQDAGRPMPVDILILLHGFWIVVSLFVNHGPARIAYAGMSTVELFCGYLVGRILIRDASSFKFFFQALLVALLILLPFALLEMSNGRALLQEIFRSILGSAHPDIDHPPRHGFHRAQTVMQHPILWGCFSAVVVANVFYIWRDRLPAAFACAGVAALASFSSMASGAVLNLLLQALLIVWGWATKGAWKLLIVAFIAVYLFLSVASNRGPIVIMIQTLTFDSWTAWYRLLIWEHGIDDAMANPIFGIGLNDWTRLDWMGESVDAFWLLIMMRHGFVGFGVLAAALAWHIWKVVTAKGLSIYERRLREGYMIALVALFFSLSTVHFWGPPYLLMFAYIGAGAWLYSDRQHVPAPADLATLDANDEDAVDGLGVRERDLPFSRSLAGPAARPEDVPLSRTAVSMDVAPPSASHENTQSFSRRLSSD